MHLFHNKSSKSIVMCLFIFFSCLVLSVVVYPQSVQSVSFPQNTDTFQENPSKEKLSEFGQEEYRPVLFKSIFSLVLIVGLICFGAWVFKRFYQSKTIGKSIPIHVVGSTFLGQKKSICLVDIEDRRLVLGVTDTSISFLAELDKKADSTLDEHSISTETIATGRRFRDILSTLLKKRGSHE